MAWSVSSRLQPAAPAPRRVSHQLGRLHPVAGLGVDRHGHVDAPPYPRGGGQHLVGRRLLVVLVAERSGHTGAGGRDHREPGRDDGSRRGHVPGVRKEERVAGAVQRPQEVASALKVGAHAGNLSRPARDRGVGGSVANPTGASLGSGALMTHGDPRGRLLGRRGECEALDQLMARLRTGRSPVLVLRGEAGVGKTALLEYLVEEASWMPHRPSDGR